MQFSKLILAVTAVAVVSVSASPSSSTSTTPKPLSEKAHVAETPDSAQACVDWCPGYCTGYNWWSCCGRYA